MRLLIFHNILWSQYKSVIFEKLQSDLSKADSDLLVIQTCITEESRKELVNFDVNNFPFKYNFRLISSKTLENVNKLKILIYRLYYIFQFKPTTINFTGYNEFGTMFLLILCRLLSIKTIITNESISISSKWTLIDRLKFFYKIILFQLVDGFFSYGIKSNTYLFKHHVPRKKIYSFLNTFDKSKFTIHQKPRINEGKYLLYVGRLSNEKNLTALINLFDRIKGEISEYHLIIIGNGPDRQTLQEKIKSLDLTTQIKLLGSINWEDLSIYFKHAECLILPSKFEPWGMVANEAQEMGLPVICSSACGCSNDLIIDNYTGIIFEEIITQKNDEKIVNFLHISNNLSIRNFILKNSNIFNLDRLSMEMLRKI